MALGIKCLFSPPQSLTASIYIIYTIRIFWKIIAISLWDSATKNQIMGENFGKWEKIRQDRKSDLAEKKGAGQNMGWRMGSKFCWRRFCS